MFIYIFILYFTSCNEDAFVGSCRANQGNSSGRVLKWCGSGEDECVARQVKAVLTMTPDTPADPPAHQDEWLPRDQSKCLINLLRAMLGGGMNAAPPPCVAGVL